MAEPRGVDRSNGVLLVIAMIAVMWVSEGVDSLSSHRLDQYGIQPRSEDGLPGIVVSPFLHSGWDHLISNSVPFAALGATIALGGLARVAFVTVVVALTSGLGTWLIADPNTTTIGASGIVFGYGTYLIARGAFSRDRLHLVVGLLVGLVWGGALLGGLLPQEGISWQAHLFGAVGGVLAARMLASRHRTAAPRATTAA